MFNGRTGAAAPPAGQPVDRLPRLDEMPPGFVLAEERSGPPVLRRRPWAWFLDDLRNGEWPCRTAPRSAAGVAAALGLPPPPPVFPGPPALQPAAPEPERDALGANVAVAALAEAVAEPGADGIVAALEETVRGALVCRHAGDSLRWSAFLTDAGLRQAVGVVPERLDDVLFEPAPAREDRVDLVDVREVTTLAAGRVGAVVVQRTTRDELTADYVVFVERGGRYLIDVVDEGYDLPVSGAPDAGTPTP